MKTTSGYEIKDFTILETPIEVDGIKFPYQGILIGGWISDIKVKWDEKGRCSNLQRQDCFIDINELAVTPKIIS